MLAGPGVKAADLLVEQANLIGEAAGVPVELRAFNQETQQRMFAIVQEAKSQQDARTELAELWKQRKRDAAASEALNDDAKRTIANGDATFHSQIEMVCSPWMVYFLNYDPAQTLQRVHVPVLAIDGSKDLQVPARQNLPAIEAALKAGGNSRVRIVELPGLNHLLQKAGTGSPAEYALIEQTIDPQALTVLGDWVVARSR
jgi:hypothetical protein